MTFWVTAFKNDLISSIQIIVDYIITNYISGLFKGDLLTTLLVIFIITLFSKRSAVFIMYAVFKRENVILKRLFSNAGKKIAFSESDRIFLYLILKLHPKAVNVITGVNITAYAPIINAYAERFVHSNQYECFDHFIVISERHTRYIMCEWIQDYNTMRTHQGIGDKIPAGCNQPATGKIKKEKVLFDLYTNYYRAAWLRRKTLFLVPEIAVEVCALKINVAQYLWISQIKHQNSMY